MTSFSLEFEKPLVELEKRIEDLKEFSLKRESIFLMRYLSSRKKLMSSEKRYSKTSHHGSAY